MLGKKIVCPNCSKNVAMPSSPFGVGRMIGDYIIEEKLGEGSIGTVYLAHQASLDRKVALKILSEQYANAKGMSAFLSEARSAAKLLHPNLVQCFGVGEENGVCYMAMNYIKGKTLKDKIKSNGKIDVDEALHITQQVAEALHCAWEEARLIHRDVKPENIMIDDDGVVKLTDLGLAMPQTAWHENMEISGSPSYMSPEQFTGEKLDSRSDIYSLGVSLYQMLCGKLPFVGKTLNSVARQHFKEKAVPINKLVPTTPRAVSDLVGKMMAKNPDDRFKSMEDLLQEIWRIRQTTAPERELVPEVHTVTMKKLDYDLQLQSKARKIQIQMSEHEERKKSEVLIKIVAITVPIVVIAVILLIAMFSHNDVKNQEGNKLIENLESMLADEDESLVALDDEFEKTKKALGKLVQKPDPYMMTRLSLCETKIENIRIKEKNKLLEAQVSSSGQRLREIENKMQETSNVANDSKEKEKRIKQLESKIQSIQKDLEKEREIVQNLRNRINSMREREMKLWIDDLRVKTAILIRNGKFLDVYALLKISSQGVSAKQERWIDDKKEEVENIEKIFTSIENSGQRFAGLALKEGKLKEINGATATVINNSNVAENISWRNLSTESLKMIIPPDVLSACGDKLPYYLAMLNGRFSEANEIIVKETELKDTMLAVRNYVYENIRYLAATDKKKAAARSEDFFRDFDKTQDLDKLKKELKSVLDNVN